MEIGHAVKGIYKGEKWKSEIFYDAEDMSNKYYECINNSDYSDIKLCNVYIHYEVMEKFE